MDSELRRLAKSVESGAIRDPDRVREILAHCRSEIDRRKRNLSKCQDLLFEAEQAFLRGWPITES